MAAKFSLMTSSEKATASTMNFALLLQVIYSMYLDGVWREWCRCKRLVSYSINQSPQKIGGQTKEQRTESNGHTLEEKQRNNVQRTTDIDIPTFG